MTVRIHADGLPVRETEGHAVLSPDGARAAQELAAARSAVTLAELARLGAFPVGDVALIEPGSLERAFFPFFFGGGNREPYERRGPVAIVDVMGPLMQRGGWFSRGYNDVRSAFEKAITNDDVGTVVLRIDSPGGMCAGCFETTRAMLAMKKASGKRVVAFADEMAASAAYAIACVADEIVLPASGRVGSVGVILTLAEQSEALKKEGIRVEVITTGKQKADGHAAVPLTDAAIARFREVANHLNSLFVSQVSDARKMTPAAVLALEAGMFFGEAAVAKGLADRVLGLDALVDELVANTKVSPPRAARTAARGAAESTERTENMSGNDSPAGTGRMMSFALIAVTLGLAASASEEEVATRAQALQRERDACAKTQNDLLALTGKGTPAEALGTIQGWKVGAERAEQLGKELGEFRQASAKREIDGLIEDGKRLGKIMSEPLEAQLRGMEPAQLRAMLEALPAVGGGAAVVRSAPTDEPKRPNVLLNKEDEETARQLGLTPEQMAAVRRDELAQKAS